MDNQQVAFNESGDSEDMGCVLTKKLYSASEEEIRSLATTKMNP